MVQSRLPLLVALTALLASGLAGCFSSDDADETAPATSADHGPGFQYDAVDAAGLPAPYLLCHDAIEAGASARCNFEMTPDEGRQGNEVTIAVNPLDPRNIVGGAKDYYPDDAGECVWDGVYVTHDGGRSIYQDRSFDGSPWRALVDPASFQPNYASQFWCTTDPVAYFDVNGNLYYLLMAYQADRITGSKTCEEECPSGSLNDWAFNRAVQIVAISDDGGDTFHTFTPVLEGTYPIAFHDKGWIAASRDGTVHVMWLSFVLGNLYFRSTDGGQTYSEATVLAPFVGGGGQGSFVDVGTDAQVYALWSSGSSIELRRSFDFGASWDEQRSVQATHPADMPGLSERDRRGGFPALATDRNVDSPFADAMYVVWQDACQEPVWAPDCTGGPTNVYLTSSFDEGETWSNPVRVSDAGGVGKWQIFPTVSVSPGGVIDVSWMDARSDPAGERLDQFYSYSLDGGKTWSQDFRVRDADDQGWDTSLSHHQNGMVFIGDYNDIDSSWQAAHPVWPDTRSGEVVDVYTATIERPMFAQGWSPQARAVAEDWIRAHPLSD